MKILDIIKISRPVFWFIFPLIFYFGVKIAGGSLNSVCLLMMFWLSFPICFYGYGINDIYDYKSDRINPRKKLEYMLKKKDIKFVKTLSSIIAIFFIFSVALTMNFTLLLLSIFFVILGYFYSAPPLRLKERPPLDSISNGLIYFLLPFSMGFSIYRSLFSLPTKVFWITGCVTATHALTTIVDVEFDRKAKQKTFSIRFGARNAAIFAFFMFTLTLIFNTFSLIPKAYLIFSIFLSFLLAIHPTPKLAYKVSILIFVGFLISGILYLFLGDFLV